jgi:hypothetical protein
LRLSQTTVPLEPTPSTATTGHTAETDTSWTRTTSLECPGPYPPGQRIGDDEGWALIDGVCTVSAPPPVCDERHLGVLEPPPDGARTCTCDLDCPDKDFCGAGYCRPREGALITICIEEYWYEGESNGIPGGQFLFADSSDDGSGADWNRALWTPPATGCRLPIRQCEQFPPSRYYYFDSFFITIAGGSQACDDGYLRVPSFEISGAYTSPLTLSTYANQGCLPIAVENYGEHTLWLSVWYP